MESTTTQTHSSQVAHSLAARRRDEEREISTGAIAATVFFPASSGEDDMNMVDLQIDMQRSLLAMFSQSLGPITVEGIARSSAGVVRGRVVISRQASGDEGALDSNLQRALHALTDAVPIGEVTNALSSFRRATRSARAAAATRAD